MIPIGNHLRGPRPSISDLLELKRQEVNAVLNLERGYFEFIHGEVNEETENVIKLGMIPVQIEFGDLVPPTKMQMDAALWVLTDTKTFGKVYIHCLHGADRTGLVCAYYNVKALQMPLDDAIQDMYKNRYHRIPYDVLGWTEKLREYCGQ